MDFDPSIPTESFDRIHDSFMKLCAATQNLKKAKLRAQRIRRIEKAALIAVAALAYIHIKNCKESE